MIPTICSGALFYALDTKRFLFVHRAQSKRSNVWGLVGGTLEGEETEWEGCEREIQEEIGVVSISKTMPLEKFKSRDSLFVYHTYLCVVQEEFQPCLNCEHNGYAWVTYNCWPNPLHYGVKNTLNKKVNQVKISTIVDVLDQIDQLP